jgi:hypothetical protein
MKELRMVRSKRGFPLSHMIWVPAFAGMSGVIRYSLGKDYSRNPLNAASTRSRAMA